MNIKPEQSRQILEKQGIRVNEACDKCGKLLGSVRFTIYGQKGVWCSLECRDGVEAAARYDATRHRQGGRPKLRLSVKARLARRREQNRIAKRAERLGVSKNHPVANDSKQLAGAKIADMCGPIGNWGRLMQFVENKGASAKTFRGARARNDREGLKV